ncbi:MAG TPA: hypothetical protein DHV28_00980 [Ignavibacteriales bacterium]|nr:hypothetical protein [Ignavibacteriales bacterium]
MVGSHTFIGKNPNIKLEQLSFLKHEPWFNVELLETSTFISMFMSCYEGYPYTVYKNENWTVIVEGMIYNLSDNELKNNCELLANKFVDDDKYLDEVNKFADLCDGDFIVQIFDKKSDRYLVFNDYLARLPLYYSFGNDILTISRDIKTNLEFASNINIDLTAVTEFLMLSYTFGDKTYFRDIKRLEPYQIILVEDLKNPQNYLIKNTCSISYNRTKFNLNKTEILKKLTDQFLIDTKNRLTTLRNNEYDVISAMSGGFDSRAVLGALSKFDKNIKYFTFEYIQDESKEANWAFNELDKPGEYVKLKFENVLNINTIEDLVYKINGSVDFLTTSVCYNDAASLREYLNKSKRIGHFSGYGGEFIRCPQMKFFKSIFYGLNNRFYNLITLDSTISVFNSDSFIKNEISDYFKKNYKKNKEAQLRKFYEEYAKVPQAGEERGRLFNWTVHPMWSKEWIKTVYQEIPLQWTGYQFFIEFLKLIDKRLLNAPIFNRPDLDLKSEKSISDYEKKYRKPFGLKSQVQLIANYYTPFFTAFYRKLKKKNKNVTETNNEVFNDFTKYYNKLKKLNAIFNLDKVKVHISSFGGKYNRLTTMVIYFSEIEKRYLNKLEEIKK